MVTQPPATLVTLSDTGQTVADPRQDVRGRTVKDNRDQVIGTVHNLLIDSRDHTVRMLRIEHGGILGFGATASFLPVEAISQITQDTVYVHQSSQQVADAPGYDPDLADQMDYYTNVYGYYGFSPYWGGYPAGR